MNVPLWVVVVPLGLFWVAISMGVVLFVWDKFIEPRVHRRAEKPTRDGEAPT